MSESPRPASFVHRASVVAVAMAFTAVVSVRSIAASGVQATSSDEATVSSAGPDGAAAGADPEPGGEWSNAHVLVKLRPGQSLDVMTVIASGGDSVRATATVARSNAVLASQIGLDRWVTVTVAPGGDVIAMAEALASLPSVEIVTLDGVGGVADLVPNDPSFVAQWSMLNTGQMANGVAGAPGADVKATQAWSLATGGRSVLVAVLDSGVWAHPDLAGRVVAGWNVPQQNGNTTDVCNSHGTHVSGIIGAAGNNSLAIAGLCWDARIMPVVVVNPCSGLESFVADGITWAVDHGAEIINMSLQYSVGSAYLHDAVLYAAASGVPMIAAAGNSGSSPPAFPARWPETIAVAATDNQDVRWTSSNFGPQVDLAAPGVAVLSLAADGGTTIKSGTSMATPHVTGVVALMRSVNDAISPEAIRSLLTSTADDVNAPGFDEFTGWGRVNAFEAVAAAIDAIVIPGDLNGDGSVNGSDLALLLGQWGGCEACQECVGDLDGDCAVGGSDLAILLGHWTLR